MIWFLAGGFDELERGTIADTTGGVVLSGQSGFSAAVRLKWAGPDRRLSVDLAVHAKATSAKCHYRNRIGAYSV